MTNGDDPIHQFITLRAQLLSQLSCQCKWRGMPELLNELDASRKFIETTGRGQSRRPETSRGAAFGAARVRRFRASETLDQNALQSTSW